MQQKSEFQRLCTAYRTAWREFVLTVDCCQSKADILSPQQFALLMEQAESRYRKSRNELADYMVSNTSNELSNAA